MKGVKFVTFPQMISRFSITDLHDLSVSPPPTHQISVPFTGLSTCFPSLSALTVPCVTFRRVDHSADSQFFFKLLMLFSKYTNLN